MVSLFDRWIKKPAFGCRECGQCLLTQTSYICPMNCPKGLRNGPCGGTLEGKCEVFPDQPCIWVKILGERAVIDAFHPPFDPALVGSSSLVNYLTSRDRHSRKPRAFAQPGSRPNSGLARKLESGKPVITLEVASPREMSGLPRVVKYLEPLKNLIDAVNATSGAAGKPSVHSMVTADVIRQAGLEAIVQFCGRDHRPEELRDMIAQAAGKGHRNMLMLTGDWNPDSPATREPANWFAMDSLQMVDIAARSAPPPFIGVAAHPNAKPATLSVNRLTAKNRAGARFTQTQLVTETEGFGAWLRRLKTVGIDRDFHIIASVPVVGKPGAWNVLQRLPGVKVSPIFARHIETSGKMEKTGVSLARRLIGDLFAIGVDGVHLMNFGASSSAIADVIHSTRALYEKRAA